MAPTSARALREQRARNRLGPRRRSTDRLDTGQGGTLCRDRRQRRRHGKSRCCNGGRDGRPAVARSACDRRFGGHCVAARRASWTRARRAAATARSCRRSEEHTSELQSLMRISYAVFCLKKKKKKKT